MDLAWLWHERRRVDRERRSLLGETQQRKSFDSLRKRNMFSVIRAFTVVLCSSVLVASVMTYPAQTTSPLGQLVLPAGFRADVFAENVDECPLDGARSARHRLRRFTHW